MKKKVWFLLFMAIVVIGSLIGVRFLEKDTTIAFSDLEKILAKHTFDQKDEEYIVYFWQEKCHYCVEVEDDIVEYANNSDVPVYVVDMASTSNMNAWYDWEKHHEENDKVIGKMVDGEAVYNEGEDLATYENSEVIDWSITVNEKNEIIAQNNTAYNNTKPQSADEIEIVGTPTMMKVKDGQLETYAFGDEEVRELVAIEEE